ncbi:hypothetical protein JOD55_001584 [Arcanobacterium pluranimalium]|nr:hypothetical protein [Arcanobacterium pluranimalium]MBM7825315.1 hypothetical protein [Arcanobacterium pluranimalium]MBM7825757.1 hypothetical protein [Arcanobacterium pluranimalium]
MVATVVVVVAFCFGVFCGLLWEVGMLLGFGIIGSVLPVSGYRCCVVFGCGVGVVVENCIVDASIFGFL